MRSVPRRRPAQEAGAERRAAGVQREPEHPVLELQRSAGNAAVSQLMRNGGGGTTAQPPGPSPSFLNSFTPLFRGLLQKFEAGEKLDRVDLDTLRELRAEAREQGLRNLVADCDDLIDRARMRGIVDAPEETAPAEEPKQEQTKPKDDREAVDAMIGSIVTAVIKDRVKNSNEHLDNWRGGRHHATVGGVPYTYYDVDDVLFTTEQAQTIEALIKLVAQERAVMMDPQALWPTVVQLSQAGHSAQDIIAFLEIYAEPPSPFELFPYWFKQAESASQPKREKEALAADTEPVSLGPPPTGKKKTKAENLEAMARLARLTGRPLKGPLSAMDRLARERTKLLALRRQYNTMPGAQFAGNEFDRFDVALATLRAMFNSLKDMIDTQDFQSVLDFDDREIFEAVEAGYRAAAKVFSVADEGYKNVQMGEEATKFTGASKPGETKTNESKRKGGSDGVWDEGFSDTEMASWLDDSVKKRSMNGQAVGSCASYLQVHKKKAGSGGTGTYFRGQMVFHISHGKKGSGDGCTVFFIHEDDGTITIVGVGSHDDAYNVAYALDWRHPDWKDGTWKGNTLIIKK